MGLCTVLLDRILKIWYVSADSISQEITGRAALKPQALSR